MSEWGCGYKPVDQDACGKQASWFGTFFIGTWRAHVPLCEEHVRNFALMSEALSQAREASGLPEGQSMAFAMRTEMAVEIYSMDLGMAGEKYGLPRQVWSCSECGLPIIRSMESGTWILAGDPSETAKVSLALHPHEHTPG